MALAGFGPEADTLRDANLQRLATQRTSPIAGSATAASVTDPYWLSASSVSRSSMALAPTSADSVVVAVRSRAGSPSVMRSPT